MVSDADAPVEEQQAASTESAWRDSRDPLHRDGVEHYDRAQSYFEVENDRKAVSELWKAEACCRHHLGGTKAVAGLAMKISERASGRVLVDAERLARALKEREALLANPETTRPPPPQSNTPQTPQRVNPPTGWEALADLVIVVLAISAVLSVVGGVWLGYDLSEETVQGGFFGEETARDSAVLAYWIGAGVASAFACLVAIAVVGLLRDISRELRRQPLDAEPS